MLVARVQCHSSYTAYPQRAFFRLAEKGVCHLLRWHLFLGPINQTGEEIEMFRSSYIRYSVRSLHQAIYLVPLYRIKRLTVWIVKSYFCTTRPYNSAMQSRKYVFGVFAGSHLPIQASSTNVYYHEYQDCIFLYIRCTQV